MRFTRENVALLTGGAELVQIDGIPEGFSFRLPDVMIGGKTHVGQYKAFVPLTDVVLYANTEQELSDLYKKQKHG